MDIAAVAHVTFHKIAAHVAASSGRVFCVRRRRLRAPSLLASQAVWKYAKDPVLLAACCCVLTAVRPDGPAEGAQGSFVAPPALLHMRRGHHKEGAQDAHNTGTAV